MDSTERAIQFVEVWQTSVDRNEVAKRLGWTPEKASVMASKLRKRGIPLVYHRGSGPRDIRRVLEAAEVSRRRFLERPKAS